MKTRVGFSFKPNESLKAAFIEALRADEYDLIIPEENPEQDWIDEHLAEVDIYLGWRPTEDYLRSNKNLKLVINPGAGIWHQVSKLGPVYKELDIALCNGHGNDYFTAQHAVSLLLSACNRLGIHERKMRNGEWRSSDADGMSIPLLNRNVGLLGYGHINQHVHSFLQGFQVDFFLMRNSWEGKKEPAVRYEQKYEQGQLNEFLKAIDILILAVPELPETVDLIGDKELDLLGEGAVLVNVARGKVVNEEALFNALKNNKLSAAGIDVWYEYQPEADDEGKKYPYHFPFHEIEHAALSPHRGGSPLQDLYRWQGVFDNIIAFRKGEKLPNLVDLDAGY